MTQRQQRQEQMAVAKPHPLRGIINSNDDPMACFACCAPIVHEENDGDLVLSFCCGASFCTLSCLLAGPRVGPDRACPQCKVPLLTSKKQIVGSLKRNAKKGHAWAQYELSTAFDLGKDGVRVSPTDSFRWAEKAAGQGHPYAMLNTGINYLNGYGCRISLSKARAYFKKGSCFDVTLESSQSCLIDLAKEHRRIDTIESRGEAKSILLPLLDNGCALPLAHFHLAAIYHSEGFLQDAYHHYSQYAIAAEDDKAVQRVALINVTICKDSLGDLAQARFWAGRVKLADMYFSSTEQRRGALVELLDSRRNLRLLRDNCGGCGAEFEGKERKFCRACRTFCYCSRECQKMHWNRKDGGHREDCKGLAELKKEMKEASGRRLMSSSTKGCC